jgi:subtilase family serine protease
MRLSRQLGRTGAGMTGVLLMCGAAASGLPLAPQPERAPAPGVAVGPAVAVIPLARVPTRRPQAQPFGGYTPAQIRAAYSVTPLLRRGINGKGTSIVIVDSFGSPTIRRDLAMFDRQFKLQAPSLLIIHPAGRIPKFQSTETMLEWANETSLDVEWAHVMAPAARIVLVETPTSENEGTSGFPQIVKAEKYVIAHHLGGVISQSFGATEQTFPKGSVWPLRGAYIEAAQRKHDITVLAATGDSGAADQQTNLSLFYTYRATEWPATDPLVTGVGGLDLNLDSAGRRLQPDRVWNDPSPPPSAGGGGLSIFFRRPAFQNGVASVVGRHRGAPDISLSASCSHPVDVYESFGTQIGADDWTTICGTSEATPLFASIVALADQVAGHPIGPINAFLYQMAARHDRGIADITRGNNTVSFNQNGKLYTVRGWNAVRGYDLSSGVGTIDARWFVPELAALAK